MKTNIFPQKLKPGDKIRVIALSRSMGLISQEIQGIANERLRDLGFVIEFGNHVNEMDDFASTCVDSRIQDLHDAFRDPLVKCILTVIGGHNSNQLLESIDWELMRNNPKILCGFSDISALSNAIFSKTGLVTYSGPHYSSFGQKLHFEFTLDHFKKCLMEDVPINLQSSSHWSDDPWYISQDNRNLELNTGMWVINGGKAQGTILGGNLCTLNLLHGTDFMPDLRDSILLLEDDSLSFPANFDRDLQSVIHQPGFEEVRGIVIGRFQRESKVNNTFLKQIIMSKRQLRKIPVIAGADFGHTDPKITFPIGGKINIQASESMCEIEITEH